MKIGKAYDTSVTTVRIDESKIQPIVEVMEQHPRIKRCILDDGIYLHLQDVTGLMEALDDEILLRISVSIGEIEQDCFNEGYYSFTDGVSIEKVVDTVCKEKTFGYTCQRMINSFVPLMLKMPAPCQENFKYVSTDEEPVDITYISEAMCHSIIKKLWNYAMNKSGDQNQDEFMKETDLTEDELIAISSELL